MKKVIRKIESLLKSLEPCEYLEQRGNLVYCLTWNRPYVYREISEILDNYVIWNSNTDKDGKFLTPTLLCKGKGWKAVLTYSNLCIEKAPYSSYIQSWFEKVNK